MMRRCLSLCAMLWVFASTPLMAEPLDYQTLAELTKRPEKLSGQFEQTKHLAALETQLISVGNFEYTQGDILIWVTRSPIKSRVELTPQGLTTFNSQGQDVTDPAIQSPQVAVFTELFFALMTSEWEALQEAFEMTGNVEGNQWRVQLTPKDAVLKQVFRTLDLSGSDYVDTVVLNEVNGDTTSIHFSALEPQEVPTP